MYCLFYIYPTPSFFRFFLSPFFFFDHHPHPFVLNTPSLSQTQSHCHCYCHCHLTSFPSRLLLSSCPYLLLFNIRFKFSISPLFFPLASSILLFSIYSSLSFLRYFYPIFYSPLYYSRFNFFQILSPKIVAQASEVKIHIF